MAKTKAPKEVMHNFSVMRCENGYLVEVCLTNSSKQYVCNNSDEVQELLEAALEVGR